MQSQKNAFIFWIRLQRYLPEGVGLGVSVEGGSIKVAWISQLLNPGLFLFDGASSLFILQIFLTFNIEAINFSKVIRSFGI